MAETILRGFNEALELFGYVWCVGCLNPAEFPVTFRAFARSLNGD
jgi:hypothetical protein